MTGRSTRNKIRHQALQAIAKIERCQQHLKYIDELANGQSDVITRSLPGLVEMSELLSDTLKAFRENL